MPYGVTIRTDTTILDAAGEQVKVPPSLQKPLGNLWHVFRRVWATERKNLPLKDVAAVGG